MSLFARNSVQLNVRGPIFQRDPNTCLNSLYLLIYRSTVVEIKIKLVSLKFAKEREREGGEGGER